MNCTSKQLGTFILLFSLTFSTKTAKSFQTCPNRGVQKNFKTRTTFVQNMMIPCANSKRGGSSAETLSKLNMSSLDKSDDLLDLKLLNLENNMSPNDTNANHRFDGEITIFSGCDDSSAVSNDKEPTKKLGKKNLKETIQLFFEAKPSFPVPFTKKLPPFIVEDTSVLFYDVFLLINLSLSISFWVVHRMSVEHIGTALSEGSLLCILWIVSGLFRGAFLMSAVDGHHGSDSEKGGPKAAGMLGLSTFLTAANIRIVIALIMAHIEHRPVGTVDGEMLMSLEIVSGILLMSFWRALHSYYTPRI
jgi:hypothetical protein